MDDFRIVIAGHMDHGKSTIIGRLLYDTGSLPQHVADKFERVGMSNDMAAFAFVTDQLSEEQEAVSLWTPRKRTSTRSREITLLSTLPDTVNSSRTW